ncbi:MAG: phosphatase PAP2 family protein [Bdellovibrionales bacterium]|nr:phosphatase PAP2 family protein [Bdellovibrionales bacterium]
MQPLAKIGLGVGMVGIAAPLYLLPNHFPLFHPRELPFTWIDSSIPFFPETIWIYLSEYLLIISAYFFTTDPGELRCYLKRMVFMLALSFLFFLFFPTTFPRYLFPLPDSLDLGSRFLFEIQRRADSPLNCFPSLHVGSVLTAAFLVRENQARFVLYFGWAVLICLSTLTTKQHYSWDVAGGAILALAIHKLVPKSGVQARH